MSSLQGPAALTEHVAPGYIAHDGGTIQYLRAMGTNKARKVGWSCCGAMSASEELCLLPVESC